LSKIFYSGSGVSFAPISFLDLDSKKSKSEDFVPSKVKNEAKAASVQEQDKPKPKTKKQTKPPPPQQEVDLESLKQEHFAKGEKAGRKEVEQEVETAAQALAAGLEELNELRESILTKSKEDMVRLIMAVAERIVQTEVREKEDIVLHTVERALSAAVQCEEYTLKVHPEDLEVVKRNKPLFMARIKGLERVHVLADASVSKGGCLAESRLGDVDASLETQLQEMTQQLQEEVLS
jgi:flagellar assembly protein FliH